MKLRYSIAGAVLAVTVVGSGIAIAANDDAGTDIPDDVAEVADNNTFVGLSLAEATSLAEDTGRQWRISRRDGEVSVLTDDWIPGRVTFEVDDGMITDAYIETESEPFGRSG